MAYSRNILSFYFSFFLSSSSYWQARPCPASPAGASRLPATLSRPPAAAACPPTTPRAPTTTAHPKWWNITDVI
jgi:hypothetical protein